MSTDNQDSPTLDNEDEALVQILEELDDIDETADEAQLNKCSIEDNNGGRVELMKRHRQRGWTLFIPVIIKCIVKKLIRTEQEDSV